MKITFIFMVVLGLVTLGWSTRISIPVGITTNKAIRAMETFFPETRPPPVRVPPPSDLLGMMRKVKEEIAMDQAREEWAALTKRFMSQAMEEVKSEDILKQDRGEEEHKEGKVVDEEVLVESDEREEEVEARFYSQIELSEMKDSKSKRGLLNWVMQMEYAGQTFFDGYVFSILVAFRSVCPSRICHP